MSSDGVATMRPSGNTDSPASAEREVTITATPRKVGKTLTYTFTLLRWYKISTRVSVTKGGENYASSACNSYKGPRMLGRYTRQRDLTLIEPITVYRGLKSNRTKTYAKYVI